MSQFYVPQKSQNQNGYNGHINTLKQWLNYAEGLATLKQFYLRRAQFT